METNIKLKEIKINSSIKKYELKTTVLGYASKGLPGKDGMNGENGVTFTPSVDNEGNLSWTNNGNLDNPETKNIKGPKGEPGPKGDTGEGVPSGGATGQVLKKKSNTDYDTEWVNESGGSGGTSDYTDLTNKPKINNVELNGNKSLSDLGITSPTKTSDLVNDSGFLTNSIVELQGTDANPVNINTLEAGYYRVTGTLILGEHTMGTGLNNWDTLVIGEWYTSSVSTSYRKIIPTKLTVSMGKLQNPGMYYIISANESEGNITYTIKPYTMQEELISGTNIKTINNESILGAGNLAIAGGADIPIGPTPPENPEDGDFWVDTTANGETYGDTLPIGAIVEYDGTTVPAGYEKVSDGSIASKSAILVGLSANVSITSSTSWTNNKIIFNNVLRKIGDGFSLDTSTGVITASEKVKAFKCTLCLKIQTKPSFEVYPVIQSQSGLSAYTEYTTNATQVKNETIDKCDTNKAIYGVFRTSGTGAVSLTGTRQYTYMLVEEL